MTKNKIFLNHIDENKNQSLNIKILEIVGIPLETFLNVHLHVASLCTEQSTVKPDVGPYASDKGHLTFPLPLDAS